MADEETFRTTSTFFNEIPWRTDAVSAPSGLNKLESVSDVCVYLGVIREQEKLCQSGSTYFAGMEKLMVLRRFCLAGDFPEKQADVLVKEFLKYGLLDAVAFIFDTASESNSIERGEVPFIDKIGHATMGDWPKVVKTAIRRMESDSTYIFLGATTVDDRLSACYHAVCHATGNVHRTKIIQNFAAAAFHLYYLLRGNLYLPNDKNDLKEALGKYGVSVDHEDFDIAPEMLQNPLYIALALSPLFLLVNRSLINVSFGKTKMFELWKAFGNKRPIIIRKVEKRLLRVIFDIVTSKTAVTIPELLEGAFTDISAMGIDNICNDAASWFTADNRIPKVPVVTSECRVNHHVNSPDSSARGAASIRGGPGVAVYAEEEEEEESDEDEEHVCERLRRLGDRNSEEDDSCGQGNSDAWRGAYRHQQPERLTGNSDMDIAMNRAGDVDREGIAQKAEQLGRAGGEDENPSPMDVDADAADVANRGESGVVDSDVGMTEGSMHELDKAPNDATPESSPSKIPSPSDSLSYEKNSPIAGEKRKNPTREAKTKKMDELPLPRPKTKLKSRSRPKPKPKPGSKIQSRAQPVDAVERNYFEEIEFGGVSRLVDIIDLTQDMISHLPSPNLSRTRKKRFVGKSVRLWAPGKVDPVTYTPSFHFANECSMFKVIHNAVIVGYKDGRPLWMACPEESAFRILSKQEFESKSEQEIQSIFRRKHVVIHDQFEPTLAFDEKGLKTLGDLYKSVTIHDYSIENSFEAESSRHLKGTLEDMLRCHREKSKILNALDFPMLSAPHPPTSFASDLLAFSATVDLPMCGRAISFPTASTRWGLAATSGAHHLWHIDCNGFCTYVDTQTGMKWWIVAKPKPGSMHFSDSALFTEGYDISAANLEKWDLEAVLLCPGSRLLMRPNTPHFVVTPESAICHGGHFYAMSTIQDTVFALYHMFVASKRVTNTEHSYDAHLLLRRMVTYLHYVLVKRGSKLDLLTPPPTPHIPDVSTFEGVLDLLMLCVIMELGDLINPLAYRKKYRHGPKHDYDRLCTIHACGLSRDLRLWWCARYMFLDPEKESSIDGDLVFKSLLSQHIAALISYKTMAEEKDVQGEVLECTADVLTDLLKKYFPSALRFGVSEGFEWAGPKYTVKARAAVLSSYTRCCDILSLGATPVDLDFVHQYNELVVESESDANSSDDSDCDSEESDSDRYDESESSSDNESNLNNLDDLADCPRPRKRRRHEYALASL